MGTEIDQKSLNVGLLLKCPCRPKSRVTPPPPPRLDTQPNLIEFKTKIKAWKRN